MNGTAHTTHHQGPNHGTTPEASAAELAAARHGTDHAGSDAPEGHHVAATGGHGHQGAQGDHGAGHSDHAGMFRRRFWWSLLLSLPIVVTAHMIQDWFGYRLAFPGDGLVGPVLGTIVFLYGGWPFLTGGLAEARSRQPGMM
ncbi:MAG: heavy metal translocating P-type ATPase, partial [Actinomycetota bacterium]|nr:heavy metal translocating P-type ATPase [Actinomycetota bacterium]